jgi:hypothetical protein
MNEKLPPPSWSPTGESGYWVWREEYNERTKTQEYKWKWLTDEEYEKLKEEENGIQNTRR